MTQQERRFSSPCRQNSWKIVQLQCQNFSVRNTLEGTKDGQSVDPDKVRTWRFSAMQNEQITDFFKDIVLAARRRGWQEFYVRKNRHLSFKRLTLIKGHTSTIPKSATAKLVRKNVVGFCNCLDPRTARIMRILPEKILQSAKWTRCFNGWTRLCVIMRGGRSRNFFLRMFQWG